MNAQGPPSNILLWGVVGSTAHGLATPASDIDTLGVFSAPTLQIAGLDWHSDKESYVKHEPDITLHEIGKAARLILKANPTVLELLFLEDYYIKTPLGEELIDLRTNLINPFAAMSAYRGYAKSQIERFERNARNGKVERKTARHTLRLIEQGTKLMTEGTFSIRVDDPQRYFALDDMEYDHVVEYLNQEFTFFERLRAEDSPLDFDREAAVEWLRKVRKTYL